MPVFRTRLRATPPSVRSARVCNASVGRCASPVPRAGCPGKPISKATSAQVHALFVEAEREVLAADLESLDVEPALRHYRRVPA